jgi:hypothetical protein
VSVRCLITCPGFADRSDLLGVAVHTLNTTCTTHVTADKEEDRTHSAHWNDASWWDPECSDSPLRRIVVSSCGGVRMGVRPPSVRWLSQLCVAAIQRGRHMICLERGRTVCSGIGALQNPVHTSNPPLQVIGVTTHIDAGIERKGGQSRREGKSDPTNHLSATGIVCSLRIRVSCRSRSTQSLSHTCSPPPPSIILTGVSCGVVCTRFNPSSLRSEQR